MTEHYYAQDPKVKSATSEWEATLRGTSLKFKTDAGVFSKGGIDFGSRLLVESFQMPSLPGDILDMGCGYGPIGLTIARLFPDRQVHLIDVNERALLLSKQNADRNEIFNVEIYASSAVSEVKAEEFAVVLTNPPIRAGKETVFSFYDGAFSKLKSGGELWVVIQKKQGAPSTIKRLERLFSSVEVIEKKKGYTILRAQKS